MLNPPSHDPADAMRRHLPTLCLLFAVLLLPARVRAAERAVWIDHADYRTPGTLSLPSGCTARHRCAALVLLHGTGSSKDEVNGLYARLAQRLAAIGVASLRIDFAGTGDSPVDYRHYTLSSATRDAGAALDWLRAQPGIDAQRLGLVGASQGGLIAQLLAERVDGLRYLLLLSSVGDDGIGPFKPWFDQYYEQARVQGYATTTYDWRSPLDFPLQWFEEVRAQTALSDFGRYHGALLAIAGDEDDVVPYASSIRLLKASGSRDASLVLIKGADHIFRIFDPQQSKADEALAAACDWLRRRSGP